MHTMTDLRQECFILMAQNGYVKRGSLKILAGKLNCNRNQLSMALSGYRASAGSEKILNDLKSELLKLRERSQAV
jgi:hypothetical protein